MSRSAQKRVLAAGALALGLVAVALALRGSSPPPAATDPGAPSSGAVQGTPAPAASPTTTVVAATSPAPAPSRGADTPSAASSGSVDVSRELIKLGFDWDHSPDARDRVLADAVRLGGPEVVRWLAQLAMTDPAGARAAGALSTLADPRAADQLLRLARSDGSPLVRASAAHALGASGGRAHSLPLAALVEDRAQPERVREESAFALGRIGGPDVVPALTRALTAAADDPPEAEPLRDAIRQAIEMARAR